MRGWWLVLFLGCSATPRLTPKPAVVRSARARPRIVAAPRVEMRCFPEASCKVAFAISIENCTEGPAELTSLSFEEGRDLVGREYDPVQTIAVEGDLRLSPFEGLRVRPGDYRLMVGVRVRGVDIPLSASLRVAELARDHAEAKCRAQGDDWGVHGGVFSSLGCQAVMTDSGLMPASVKSPRLCVD